MYRSPGYGPARRLLACLALFSTLAVAACDSGGSPTPTGIPVAAPTATVIAVASPSIAQAASQPTAVTLQPGETVVAAASPPQPTAPGSTPTAVIADIPTPGGVAAGPVMARSATPRPTTMRTPPAAATASEQAPATTIAVVTLAGDGQIDTDQLFHDSRDPNYRSPGGAVLAGTEVTLRLKTKPGDLTSAKVRLWDANAEAESFVPMTPIAPDMWEAKVKTPSDGVAYYYHFVVDDGQAEAFYFDDKALDGGKGEALTYNTEQDYSLVAYRSDFSTPSWVKDGIVYQIFPDRFYNGDPANDKPAGSFEYGGTTVQHKWGDAPTGGNDFFGGDLQGVTDKLDYLQSLGITAIYLNPIFKSPSNHRYDTTDYTQIDPSLGDLQTFKTLVTEAQKRHIHLILDGVFNHSSSDSIYFDKFSRYPTTGAFESKDSAYFNWYTFKTWPNRYLSWSTGGKSFDTLPQFTETDAVKDFLFRKPDSVVAQWTKEGLGGWRLDAGEKKSHAFWQDFRTSLKALDPEAVIVGEYWYDASPWLVGNQWDGVMDYRFRDAVQNWLANPARNVDEMVSKLAAIREDYPPQALAASFNLIDSHDTARALNDVQGDKKLLKLMALMQFTWPGMPTVYYGDEAGMTGAGDPDCRRTYPWGSEDKDLISYYSLLARVRHANTALSTGQYIDLKYDNQMDVYAYARKDQAGAAVVALNRSTSERELDVPVGSVAQDGATFQDQLDAGTRYTVQGGTLKIRLAGEGGVLLLQK